MKRHARLIILSFMLMMVLGFINNMRGALIPSIRGDFGVDYSKIGLMLFVATFGFMMATFFGGMAAGKYGLKRLVIFGLTSVTVGIILMLYIDSFFMLIILMAMLGAGLGCLEIGTNSLGAKIFIKKSGMMMNLLHLFFGIGASIGPRYAGWLLSKDFTWNYVYLSSLILVGGVFLFLLFTSFPGEVETKRGDGPPVRQIITEKKAWLFTAVLGFAVVAEIGTANWLVNFLQVERGLSTASSSFYLSLFFITFTAGRLLGSYFTELLGYVRIIFYFAGMTLLLFITGLMVTSPGAIFFSLAGFFISIMFPTVMAILMQEFKEGVSAYMGFVITGGSAINMFCNWFIGKTTDLFGVYVGFASISLYIFLIIFFLWLLKTELDYNSAAKQEGAG